MRSSYASFHLACIQLITLLMFTFVGECLKAHVFPIVIKGHQHLLGFDIRRIHVYQAVGGQLRLSRFQIDELNKYNEYVLPEGLPYTRNSDDGLFDENDELVFLSDSLTPCAEVQKLETKDFGKAWVVKVESRQQKALGCVIVAVHTAQPPRADAPLVSFDRKGATVSTPYYRYEFSQAQPVLLGKLWLRHPDGAELPLLKSSQFMFHFKLPWYLPNFSLNDENFSSEIESWYVGSVRTIVAVGVRFRNLLSMFNLHMFSELVFYPSAFQIPTVVEMRMDPSDFLKRGSGIAYAVTLAQGAELSTTLPTLPEDDAQSLWDSGARASHIELLAANADFGDAYFSMQVRTAADLKNRSLPPYFVPRGDFGNTKKAKNWNWLEKMDGDFGVFIDTAGLQRGAHDFGLDLFLSSKADQSIIADYKDTVTVWSVMASH